MIPEGCNCFNVILHLNLKLQAKSKKPYTCPSKISIHLQPFIIQFLRAEHKCCFCTNSCEWIMNHCQDKSNRSISSAAAINQQKSFKKPEAIRKSSKAGLLSPLATVSWQFGSRHIVFFAALLDDDRSLVVFPTTSISRGCGLTPPVPLAWIISSPVWIFRHHDSFSTHDCQRTQRMWSHSFRLTVSADCLQLGQFQ